MHTPITLVQKRLGFHLGIEHLLKWLFLLLRQVSKVQNASTFIIAELEGRHFGSEIRLDL